MARQHSGTLGKVTNCQIAVSVHAATDTRRRMALPRAIPLGIECGALTETAARTARTRQPTRALGAVVCASTLSVVRVTTTDTQSLAVAG